MTSRHLGLKKTTTTHIKEKTGGGGGEEVGLQNNYAELGVGAKREGQRSQL